MKDSPFDQLHRPLCLHSGSLLTSKQNLQSLVLSIAASPCRQGQDFILMGTTCGKSQAKTDYGHAIM